MSTKTIAALIATCLIAAAVWRLTGAAPASANANDASARLKSDRVARGKYLVTAVGCHDCHTPMKMGENGPEPDMTRALSGHPESLQLPPAPQAAGPWGITAALTMTAWSGPWGVSYTANLTSDRETGLGAWTEDNFVKTIRTGRHKGVGRALLPPMPIPVYMNFSDEDLKSIYAYLQTVPAVKNRVPAPLLPAGTPQ